MFYPRTVDAKVTSSSSVVAADDDDGDDVVNDVVVYAVCSPAVSAGIMSAITRQNLSGWKVWSLNANRCQYGRPCLINAASEWRHRTSLGAASNPSLRAKCTIAVCRASNTPIRQSGHDSVNKYVAATRKTTRPVAKTGRK